MTDSTAIIISSILSLSGVIIVALFQFSPRGRAKMDSEMSMCPEEEQKFDQLQTLVNHLQSDVKVLQMEQARNNTEITQLRGELADIRRLLMGFPTHQPRP